MRRTVADAVARNLELRASRGMPPTVNDPAVLRIVASVLADHYASGTGLAARRPPNGRNRRPGP